MADSSVAITAGSGTSVDTRTVGTDEHRQVVVIGDPATNTGVAPVDITYGLAVDVKRSELPSGAATAARQDTGNTSLSSIDGKVPALGQALAAASTPVVLTAAQLSTLTPPAAITGFATESTLSTLNGKVTAVNTGAVVVSSSALPSGASTLAEQQSQTTSLQLIDDAVTTTASAITSKGMAISGTDGTNARIIKTDSNGELQIDVLTMPTTTVTGTVAATQSGTWNLTNVSGTVSLPTGAATESTLSTLNGKVTACNTSAVTISAALPAGTNAVGKLAANDGVDIGDVSINNGSTILPTLIPASSGTGAIQGSSGFPVGVIRLATRTCGSGSTTTSIVSTSHGAIVGNIIQFISGAASPSWSYVSAVPDANTITLAWPVIGSPASGNSFILGYQVPVSAVGGFTSADTGTASLVAMNTLGGVNSGSGNLLKLEDGASSTGDAGVAPLIVYRNTATSRVDANDDYVNPAGNRYGAQYVDLNINFQGDATAANSPIRAEDSAHASGDAGLVILARRIDIQAASAASGDYCTFDLSDLGQVYVDPIRRSTMTHTQPTVTNATSFTLVASNTARRYLLIQNNSAANIMVSFNNATLTGIAPTSTNIGIVIAAGAAYETPANLCPTAAITCYQTSGGSINTISVIEAS